MLKRYTAANAPNHIAQALINGDLSIAQLRAASPFPENTQKIFDTAVVEVGLDRLVLADDVMSSGLNFNLTDPLSVMEVQWDQISKTGGAQRTMHPNARGENQIPKRNQKRVPIYLTTDDFFIGIRSMRASQRAGTPLDVSNIKSATRRVNESIEDAFLNGGITADGYTAYGALNAPSANTMVYEATGGAWDAAGKTGTQILADVLTMIGKLQADRKFGPYNLYIPTLYGNAINADFKANSDLTIRQRLEEIEAGGRKLNIRVADQLPVNKTVMIQMTDDVVDCINGQSPTVIPWTSADGFTLFWMVMAIIVPRFRDDFDGNSGVVIGFTS